MNLSLILFTIGILGFVLNRKNIILMLISIEIMLLAITFLILVSSLSFDDILGQTYAIYIIAIAGAESAIGLGILVAFYRLNSSLVFNCLSCNNKTYSRNINKFFFKRIIRSYSTVANNNYTTNQSMNYKINPWFITGIFDAESSFVVTILKNPRYKTGWNVQARVQIKMHEKDRALIQSIQDFFGGKGYVSKPNKNLAVEFRVSTLKDLVDVILPHFDNYPLITKKHSDYLLFKQVVLLMLNKEHSTLEGIQKVIAIKSSLNLGLSKNLKEEFSHILPMENIDNSTKNITIYNKLDPDWVAGFSTGESNFFIAIQKSKTGRLYASLRFSVSQHSRDLLLLESFVNFFGGGYLVNYENRPLSEFVVSKFDIIFSNIIPFFEKHPILGSKHLNFLDFKSAAYIIKNKKHLNEDGADLEKILQLKERITSLYKSYKE